jgi:hypothetical protein
MSEGILLWRSFKPLTKIGWWLCIFLSSFDLDGLSLPMIEVCLVSFYFFWFQSYQILKHES